MVAGVAPRRRVWCCPSPCTTHICPQDAHTIVFDNFNFEDDTSSSSALAMNALQPGFATKSKPAQDQPCKIPCPLATGNNRRTCTDMSTSAGTAKCGSVSVDTELGRASLLTPTLCYGRRYQQFCSFLPPLHRPVLGHCIITRRLSARVCSGDRLQAPAELPRECDVQLPGLDGRYCCSESRHG